MLSLYRYAVEYNKLHEGDSFYEDKLKDLEFFEQFPFITEDCLKEKPKRKLPIDDDNLMPSNVLSLLNINSFAR